MYKDRRPINWLQFYSVSSKKCIKLIILHYTINVGREIVDRACDGATTSVHLAGISRLSDECEAGYR